MKIVPCMFYLNSKRGSILISIDDKQEDYDCPLGLIPNEVIMVLRKITRRLERLKVDEDFLERSENG